MKNYLKKSFLREWTKKALILSTDIISNGSLYDALYHLNEIQLIINEYVTAYTLNSMHESELIHRDIKVISALLDETILPHICHFGISRTAEKGSEDDVKTDTPNWMASENLECEK